MIDAINCFMYFIHMTNTQLIRQIKAALALRGKNFVDVALHAGISKQAVSQGLKLNRPSGTIQKAVEEVSGLPANDLWPME